MSRYFCYQCASRVLPEVMRVDNGVCRFLLGLLPKKKADRTTPTMMHVSNSTCLGL